MRQKIWKILLTSFIFIIVFSPLNLINSLASQGLYNLKVYVSIDNNGDAIIREDYDYEPDSGTTEYYKVIQNIGDSEIEFLRAGESENNIEYEKVYNWDIDLDIDSKKNKFGTLKTDEGYELCFGIGDYERKAFFIEYKVTKFIKKLNDADMLYWKFVNDSLNNPPDFVEIWIETPKKMDKEQNKIWAFGVDGKIIFTDQGGIYFESNVPYKKSNYTVILSKFNKDTFTSGQFIDKDFDYYKELSFEDSDYERDYESNKNQSIIAVIIRTILRNIRLILVLLFVLLGIVNKKYTDRKKIKGGFKKGDFKEEYYRSVPHNKWYNMFYVLDSTKLGDQDSLIRAIFLQFILEKRLIPIQVEKGLIFKKEVLELKINQIDKPFEDEKLEYFYDILVEASGEDLILQTNEFSKYLRNSSNLDEYQDILESYKDDSYDMLSYEGYFEKKNIYSEKGKELTANTIKYYNYLKDFTLLNEREVSEIALWKDLLIYATLFNISDEVFKQLEKLSPEILEQSNVDIDISTLYISHIYARALTTSYNNGLSARSLNSSGNGGFTSIGGGMGSFGGGSGGGGR